MKKRCCSLLLCIAILFSFVPTSEAVALYDTVNIASVPENRGSASITIPLYTHGTASSWMTYDCGEAVTFDGGSCDSKMQIIKNTNATQYLSYCNNLLSLGYTRLMSHKVAAQNDDFNRHLKYLSPNKDYVIYAYYTAHTNEVRLIVDTHKDTLRLYSYEGTGSERTEVYMYALSSADDCFAAGENEGTTQRRNNAGSMFIIKMRDNSLFVVDGGGLEQMGDRDAAELYGFCREITGTSEGERMVINTWFISHGHADHYAGFPRFICKYNDKFIIENIMYNFEVLNTSRSYIRLITKLFPNAKYYKPHTGEVYQVAGVRIDVLYTTEDRYYANGNNKLLLNDSSCITYTNENNTSTVLRLTFDGKEMILTGDLQKAEAILLARYPEEDLKADILQIPHHGADYHVNLVKTVAPKISFINQVETAKARLNVYANYNSWKDYCGDLYWGGSETVGYTADEGIFYRKADPGTDYYGWTSAVYPIENKNYQDTAPAVEAAEEHYRYSQVNSLTTSDRAYLIVDNKLNRVFSFDAINGGVSSGSPSLFDGTHYYFASSQRRLVNWLMRYTTYDTNANAAISGVKTYYGGTPVQKGSGDYWGTPKLDSGMVIARGDTFTSEGMYGTWAKGSDQFESLATGTWVDVLNDGTFLFYRHYKGTYYPFYRDASVATDGGWGTTELTKTTTNTKLDYLLLRLYAYEETASKMYLSWSGHQDYYTLPGVSQVNLISHIANDIRVNYSFEKFSGTGEIPYDAYGNQKPGCYWLEFSPAYDPNAVNDYTVSIIYKNANGTLQTVGTTTVHVAERSPDDPAPKQLYFDFGSTAEDQERYQNLPQYSGYNFDGTNRWKFTELVGNEEIASLGSVNNLEGSLTLSTSNSASTALYASPYATSATPLKYDAKDAETIQLRLRINNLKANEANAAYFRLYYDVSENGSTVTKHERDILLTDNGIFDGEYLTLTADLYTATELLNSSDASAGAITEAGTVIGIKLAFCGLTPVDSQMEASVTVDYVYIGPRENMPHPQYTVTFMDGAGNILATEFVFKSEAVTYKGTTPTKKPDSTNHYTFSGWDKALTNITADTTVTAQYTATAHSYSYANVDAANHKGTCSCGYTATTGHSWNTGVITTAATCTSVGVKTYTCSICKGTKTETVAAKGHSSVTDAAVTPTCTATGKTEGKHCSVCNEILVAQTPIAALGHDPIYTDNGTEHTVSCSRCDWNETEDHSYTDGCCLCGSVEDPYLDTGLVFYRKSMDLQSYIGVNYMVRNSVAKNYDSFYVGVKRADGEEVILDGTAYGSSFTFFSIRTAAPQMTENLAATIYAVKDGITYHGETVNWCIRDGVMEQMNALTDLSTEANRNRMTLMVDMLNYGAAAQIRFENRMDDLANNKMTEAQLAYATTASPIVDAAIEEIANDGATVKFISKSLSLQSSIEVQLMVNIKGYTADTLEARIVYGDKTDVVELQAYGSIYAQIIYDGIAAKDVREVVEITVYDKTTGKAVSNTLRCSIEALAQQMLPAQADIVNAMIRYGDAAQKVYG